MHRAECRLTLHPLSDGYESNLSRVHISFIVHTPSIGECGMSRYGVPCIIRLSNISQKKSIGILPTLLNCTGDIFLFGYIEYRFL